MGKGRKEVLYSIPNKYLHKRLFRRFGEKYAGPFNANVNKSNLEKSKEVRKQYVIFNFDDSNV